MANCSLLSRQRGMQIRSTMILLLITSFLIIFIFLDNFSGSKIITRDIEKSSLVVFIGLLGTVIAWSYKQCVISLQNRSQLLILELLSKSRSLSRTEISDVLSKQKFPYGFFQQVHEDTLSNLVISEKIIITENGYYSLPNKTKG